MKKVSVVVPCYNVSEYLGRCMDHLTRQTIGIENIEIILVNDASTDGGATWEMIMQYESQYPESIIAVSLEENLRQGGARNVGMSYASGEYLAFCDADDWLKLEALEWLYVFARKNDADVVEFRYKSVYEYTGLQMPLEQGDGSYQLDMADDEVRRRYIFESSEEFFLGCTNKVYRMSLIQDHKLRFAEHLICEEAAFTVPLRLYEAKYFFLDIVLYYYFQMPASTMHSSWDTRRLDNAKVWLILYEDLGKRGLLEKYSEELEFLFWRSGIGITVRMLMKKGYVLQGEELMFLKHMMLECCPDIQHNVYLSKYEVEWNAILLEILDMELTADNIIHFNKSVLEYLAKN